MAVNQETVDKCIEYYKLFDAIAMKAAWLVKLTGMLMNGSISPEAIINQKNTKTVMHYIRDYRTIIIGTSRYMFNLPRGSCDMGLEQSYYLFKRVLSSATEFRNQILNMLIEPRYISFIFGFCSQYITEGHALMLQGFQVVEQHYDRP